jgi:hypothetical protein
MNPCFDNLKTIFLKVRHVSQILYELVSKLAIRNPHPYPHRIASHPHSAFRIPQGV